MLRAQMRASWADIGGVDNEVLGDGCEERAVRKEFVVPAFLVEEQAG